MKAKAVVLDGFAFSGGKSDLSALYELCDITYYNKIENSQAIEIIGDSEIVFTNNIIIDKNVIDNCPSMKYVGLFSTGYDNVDVEYANLKGVCVTNIPGYSTEALAQHVFALILSYTSKVEAQNQAVRQGEWQKSGNYCFFPVTPIEIFGKTLGIFGFGRIGQRVAQVATAFNMRVIACSRSKKKADNVTFVDFETLLKESDFLTLHCPLTPETRGIINADAIKLMKPGAVLINTARGAVVDEKALADALNSGKLAFAGVDVLSKEPPEDTNPLLHAKNCLITPHTAWAPLETRQRCIDMAVENLKAFLAGHPQNKL